MSSKERDTDPRIEFKEKLQEWTISPGWAGGKPFVQTAKLHQWMTEGTPRNVERVLDWCTSQDVSFLSDSFTTDRIASGEEVCLLILSILLELDEGYLIHDLRRHGFCDIKIPIDVVSVEKVFNLLGLLERRPKLAEEFDRAQWKYRPVMFKMGEEREILPYHILPICEKQYIAKGGTATVYQVLVQEEWLNDDLCAAIPYSRYNDHQYGNCYFFALKEFNEGNKSIFKDESKAFRALRDNDGMIKCLFGFTQTSAEASEPKHYLVLELGQFNLSTYFAYYLPPVLEAERLDFWSDLFLMAQALSDIHEFDRPSAGREEKYYGWHADIKPDNILNIQGRFKLADPGFAKFEKQPTSTVVKDKTAYNGGTSSFSAPECYVSESASTSPRKIHVSRAIDIWSLGCVFSLAATWVVYGRPGLQQFEDLRIQTIKELVNAQSPTSSDDVELYEGDYFHNGRDVLTVLSEWNDYLRHGIRAGDSITRKVIELVEHRMLVGSPSARIEAKELSSELDKIVASSELKYEVPVSISKTLARIEADWYYKARQDASKKARLETPNHAMSAPAPLAADTQPRQPNEGRDDSHRFPTSMLTSHRSKAIGSGQTLSQTPPHLQIMQDTLSDKFRVPHPRTLVPRGDTPWIQDGIVDKDKQLPLRKRLLSAAKASAADFSEQEGSTSSNYATYGKSRSIPRRISDFRPSLSLFNRKHKGALELRPFYKGRDLVFIIDNGATMVTHWKDVQDLLFRLVTRAKGLDTNGMDLRFTNSETAFQATDKPTAFKNEIGKRYHTPAKGATNMSQVLSRELEACLHYFSTQKSHPRNRTFIVLTDGVWAGQRNEMAVDDVIIKFNNELRNTIPNSLEEGERRVSIQFAQFGSDEDASERLRRLDNQLKYRGVLDIVDHKPATAELDAILIGSIDESDDEPSGDPGK